MIILPAIDLKDGAVVRLYKGSFDTVHQVATDPVTVARAFQEAGATWIHMVDLDGARDARPKNSALFLEVAERTGLQVELGGGIRTMETVDWYLSRGICRVILGSAALSDPDLVRRAVKCHGERIAVGIDARDGMVAAEGWLNASSVHYLDLARAVESAGVKTIIFTDISRDGTLSGPSLEQLARLQESVSCDVIASGGIRTIEDIRVLKAMGLAGAICGKSVYEGTLDLTRAVREGEE